MTRPALTIWYNTKCPVCDAGIARQRNKLVSTVKAATIEFRDNLNQVILRETEILIVAGAEPLQAGQRRDFQVTLEHLSTAWNQQYPSIRPTGLILE